MVRLIDGKAIAAEIGADVTVRAAALRSGGTEPTLAVVVPTDDEGAAWYVRSIVRAAEQVGLDVRVERLDHAGTEQLTARLDRLSSDPAIHGIVCQTPLPAGVTLDRVGAHIVPAKDVDGANPASLGQLAAGLRGAFPPATAAAVLVILQHERTPLTGRRAVVVGRSNVVGKPAALLLLAQHATVTICHSRTTDLPAITRQADVLVVAAGCAHMLGAEHVSRGAVVIDVGTNPTADGGLRGDVDSDALGTIACAVTPVPGGVGPVTTALLLQHTVAAAESLGG